MRRIAAFLLAFLLAGCVGNGAAKSTAPSEPPAVDESTGAVNVLVFDAELRPVPNATVGIAKLGVSATTAADGSAALNRLAPGDYDLAAVALGFQSQARRVTVQAGQVASVTFHLDPLPSDVPFHESYRYVGYEACQWYVPVALSHCTLPYTIAYGAAKQNGVNLSQYGLQPDLQDNREFANVSLRPEHTAVVSELVWQAGSTLARIQALVIMCPWYDPVADECVRPGTVGVGVRYFAAVGTSPLRIEWKHPAPDDLKKAPAFWSRANVNGNATEQPAGIALDQKIEMFNTVFYGAKPPEGYSAVRDG